MTESRYPLVLVPAAAARWSGVYARVCQSRGPPIDVDAFAPGVILL
jgi:hypothetical protein